MSGKRRIGLILAGVVMLVVGGVVWAARPTDSDGPNPRPDVVDFGRPADLPDARGLALRPGKDRRLVEDTCTSCHSLAPIIRHDGFAKPIWRDEVRKMIEDYGAPIPDDYAKRIIAYLQSNYADPPPPAAGTSDAPGTR